MRGRGAAGISIEGETAYKSGQSLSKLNIGSQSNKNSILNKWNSISIQNKTPVDQSGHRNTIQIINDPEEEKEKEMNEAN